MRVLIVLLFVTVLFGSGQAQEAPRVPARPVIDQSISLPLGTLGAGLFYNRTLSRSRRLTGRVGGQYIAYRKPLRIQTAPGSYLIVDPDFMIATVQAGLKWNPFRHGSFFMAAGIGYTGHPTLGFTITANDKLNLGGLVLTPRDVGRVDLGIRWHPVVGYLGWGFGRTIPRRRIGAGFEMGVHYLGRPSIQLDYEGFLEATNLSEQVPAMERNLSNYRYLPSLSLTLTYALKRPH